MPQIRSAVRQNAAEARDARARIARKKKAREAARRAEEVVDVPGALVRARVTF